ncbi:hypothetical protein HDU92_008079, partial [Lobulomyces angularis]
MTELPTKNLITINFGDVVVMALIGKKRYLVRLFKKKDIIIISESPDVVSKLWLSNKTIRDFMKNYILENDIKLFSKYKEMQTNRYIATKIKDKLWADAKKVKGLDPDYFRKDVFGLLVTRKIKDSSIKYSIDHIIPYSTNGPTKYFNLCVMRLKMNQKKSNTHIFQSTQLVEEILEQKKLQKKFKKIIFNKNKIKFLKKNYNLNNLKCVDNIITYTMQMTKKRDCTDNPHSKQ